MAQVIDVLKVGDWWRHKSSGVISEITHVVGPVVHCEEVDGDEGTVVERGQFIERFEQVRKTRHRRAKLYISPEEIAHAQGLPATVRITSVQALQDPPGIVVYIEGSMLPEVEDGTESSYLNSRLTTTAIDLQELIDDLENGPIMENVISELKEIVRMHGRRMMSLPKLEISEDQS